MTIHLIPLDHLLRSKRNARKTKTGGVDDLAASILAHGLLQHLLVLPIDPLPDDGDVTTGRFEVIAGGRRLAALKKLAREKKIPRDHPVPCEILNGCDPIEISLAENVLRQSMHPADEFEAFQALKDAGHGPE
jgi:Predicted transcriptional regulators